MYPRKVNFPREFYWATWEFLNFEMCQNIYFWLYIDFSHFSFLGCEDAEIPSS